MTLQNDSRAVQVARAQVKAWSNHHLAVARAAVAGHATLAVTTTQAETPAVNTVVNTTGIDDYMAGLENFAKTVTPGSLKEIAALGDDRNALLMFTVEADYGPRKVTLASMPATGRPASSRNPRRTAAMRAAPEARADHGERGVASPATFHEVS